MAVVSAAVKGALGSTNVPGGTSTVPLQIRNKYSLSDNYIFKEIGTAPFLAGMTSRLRRRAKSAPKFIMLEDDYSQMGGTISGSDAGGTAAALLVTTDYVIIPSARFFLQTGSRIHVPKEQTSQTNSSADMMGEVMEVVNVYQGAATTGDWCQVVRANSTGGANATGITAASGNTLNFYVSSNASREGAGSPEAFNEPFEEIYNYTQIMKEPVEVTGTLQATDLYGPENELQYRRQKKRKEWARFVERTFLMTGQRNIVTEAGKPKRMTGGMLWWLSNGSGDYNSWSTANDLVTGTAVLADRSRIWRVDDVDDSAKWNKKLMWDYVQNIYEFGSSTNKVLFCGSGFAGYFNDLFANMQRATEKLNMFGLNITQHEVQNGVINLHPHSEMTRTGYTNWAICVDFDYVGYVYLQKGGKNRDLKLEQNIQDNDADLQKDQWIAELGLDIGYHEAHSAIAIV